jgi:hypothetical protein
MGVNFQPTHEGSPWEKPLVAYCAPSLRFVG